MGNIHTVGPNEALIVSGEKDLTEPKMLICINCYFNSMAVANTPEVHKSSSVLIHLTVTSSHRMTGLYDT